MSTTERIRPAIGQAGVTLIELIMFIVIVGAAIAGVMAILNLTTGRSADPMIRKQMLAIAESLLEEVTMVPFTYCDPDDARAALATSATVGGAGCSATVEALGPEGGELRGNNITPFDNVNDYFAAGGLAVADDVSGGHLLPAGYAATITVDGGTPATPLSLGPGGSAVSSDGTPANMDLLNIVVTVTYGAETLVLEGYRTRYAPNILP